MSKDKHPLPGPMARVHFPGFKSTRFHHFHVSPKGASLEAQTVRDPLATQETPVRSLGHRDSPGEGNGYPLRYSWLENSMDRGAWWAINHRVAQSQTQLRTNINISSQFGSVAQSCPTLCDPMDCSTPGLPIHHQLLEPTQILRVYKTSF